MKALEWHETPGAHVETDGVWSAIVSVQNTTRIGYPWSADTLTGTLYGPDGDTVVPAAVLVERVTTGFYRVTVTVPAAPGIYRVGVAGTDDTTWARFIAADVFAALPDLADIKTFLGTDAATQYGDDRIQQALDEEMSAQADACNVPAAYPSSLARALRRRVQVNLAMDGQPLAVSDSEGGAVRLPGVDPIVRKYEARYPRSPVG